MDKMWLMSSIDRLKFLCVLLLMSENASQFFLLHVLEAQASLILPPNQTQTSPLLVSLGKYILN